MKTQQAGMVRPVRALVVVGLLALLAMLLFQRLPVAEAAAGTIRFQSASYTVVEGESVGIFVERTGGTDGGVYASIVWDTVASTGDASDWLNFQATATFNQGQETDFFNFGSTDNDDPDGDRTIVFVLECPDPPLSPGDDPCGGATIGSPSTTTITIVDNDGPPKYSFGAASYDFEESEGTVQIPVTRAGDTSGTDVVSCSVSGGTASGTTDYLFSMQQLTFTPGQTVRNCLLTILNDTVVEPDKTVVLSLSVVSGFDGGAGPHPTTTVTIEDDDGPGQFSFTTSSVTVNESAGQVVLTVQRLNGVTGAVTVDYGTITGTATAPADFTATAGTLTFAAGQSSRTITVPIVADAVIEGPETFSVALSNPQGGAALGSPSLVTVTIQDNDSIGTFAFNSATYEVQENDGPASITVVRTAGTSVAASVNYATSAGPTNPATAGVDYVSASGTLNFAVGETSKSFNVIINDNDVAGLDKTVTLTLSTPTNGTTLGSPSTAVLTILDNETTQPIVTSVSPSQGPTTGGTIVTILGGNFTDATSVSFGATTTANFVLASDDRIVVVSPSGSTGTVDVRVTSPAGTSATSEASKFQYIPVPVVTNLSPNSGAASGGTTVVLTGNGFSGATRVTFGNTDATSYVVNSDTSITAIAPAGAEGAEVVVRVTNANGTSPSNTAARYRYRGDEGTLETTLFQRWTLITWGGTDGMGVEAALRGQETPNNPDTNSIYSVVSAVYFWDGAGWRSYFPGAESVPGANTLSTFEYGNAYWIAITVPEREWVYQEGP